MKLQAKTTLLTVLLSGAMVLLLVAVSLVSFRQFSLSTAQENVRSAAEIVRVSLTESMINGVIKHRKRFLERLSDVEGLLEARVVRSEKVIRQFGTGLKREQTIDAIEKQVMLSGVPFFGMIQEGMAPIFRGTIPFMATDQGDPNCLKCHSVSNDSVLGAITLHLSMAHLKRKALATIGIMLLIVVIFATFFTLFFRRQISSVVRTAEGVQAVVAKAKDGDFSGRIDYYGEDEVGWISRDLNRLMSHLQENLGNISSAIAKLMRYELSGNTNLITTTTEMVETLLAVAQFKQVVEEDQTQPEVYARIGRILTDQFGVKWFSIYDVTPDQRHIKPMVVDGTPASDCRWCDPKILEHADTCRAQRTGHLVDSFQDPHICNRFQPDNPEMDLGHLCIPVIHSGQVGNVVQIVVEREHGQMFRLLLPFIQVYLRESAPTVEAKRLLETLRESALRDPLTGLHNRRYLDEYLGNLAATAKRKKNLLSVLLLDLDHFKKVNDLHGHDMGDTVIKAVARILCVQVGRTSDLVIRYGGEEFLVVLQENQDHYGWKMAEKIRSAVERLEISLPDGKTLPQTVSIGVATFPSDSEDVREVLTLADIALYRAKEKGRNRMEIFSAEVTEPALVQFGSGCNILKKKR